MDARYRIVLVDLQRRVTVSLGVPSPQPAPAPTDPWRAYLVALGVIKAR
jgi:hypothetical protein